MSNYPDGSANDPNAPWNQKDAEFTEWEEADIGECVCCGEDNVAIDEENTCEECFIPEEIEEDED